MHFTVSSDESIQVNTTLHGSYSAGFVILSIITIILAVFVSLRYLSWNRTNNDLSSKQHLIGSSIVGLGIWSMHFLGTIALRLPIEVYYQVVPTVAALLPAIVAGYVIVYSLTRQLLNWLHIISNGLVIGLSVATMHYLGMVGMELEAVMMFSTNILFISLFVAFSLGIFICSLRSLDYFFLKVRFFVRYMTLVRSVIVGLACAGIHYVSMYAMFFVSNEGELSTEQSLLNENFIGMLSSLVSLFICALFIISFFQRHKFLEVKSNALVTHEKLVEVESRLSRLVERLPGVVYQLVRNTEGELHFIYVSDSVSELFGVQPEEVSTDAYVIFDNVLQEDLPLLYESIDVSANELSPWNHEFRIKVKGEIRWVKGNSVPEKSSDGVIVWSGFVTDFSKQKQSDSVIKRLAYYDPLTGLPNRRKLEGDLEKSIVSANYNSNYSALLFIDLDNFKDLNDALGHSYGDRMLVILGERLAQWMTDQTVRVYRIGGDEFVIIFEQLASSESEVSSIVESMAKDVIKLIGQSVDIFQVEYCCSASVGVTLFNSDFFSADELVRQADTAMYQAKSKGGGNVSFHKPETHSELTRRFQIVSSISKTISKHQLNVVFQQQYNELGICTGAEALLRWNHSELGFIPPDEFIPIAESSGDIIPIGSWVLEEVCMRIRELAKEQVAEEFTVSVNVSPKQFHCEDFVEQVLAVTQRNGVSPEKLCLELTETTMLSDTCDSIQKMNRLRSHGIRLSMDDFGTGYSSMSYFTQLPLDEVKIDKSFVQRANDSDDSKDWIVIESIINLAHNLDISVVAEGVETEYQKNRLMKFGCDHYQGYLFGIPKDWEALDFTQL